VAEEAAEEAGEEAGGEAGEEAGGEAGGANVSMEAPDGKKETWEVEGDGEGA